MAENLHCFVKKCNTIDYKDSHLCKKHFYKLPKDKREQLLAMKVVYDIGQVEGDKYFYFIRSLCQLLEPELIIVTPKLLSSRLQLQKIPPSNISSQPFDNFLKTINHIEQLLRKVEKLVDKNNTPKPDLNA